MCNRHAPLIISHHIIISIYKYAYLSKRNMNVHYRHAVYRYYIFTIVACVYVLELCFFFLRQQQLKINKFPIHYHHAKVKVVSTQYTYKPRAWRKYSC